MSINRQANIGDTPLYTSTKAEEAVVLNRTDEQRKKLCRHANHANHVQRQLFCYVTASAPAQDLE